MILFLPRMADFLPPMADAFAISKPAEFARNRFDRPLHGRPTSYIKAIAQALQRACRHNGVSVVHRQ